MLCWARLQVSFCSLSEMASGLSLAMDEESGRERDDDGRLSLFANLTYMQLPLSECPIMFKHFPIVHLVKLTGRAAHADATLVTNAQGQRI